MALNPAVYYRMEPSGDGSQLVDSTANKANATVHVGRAIAPVWTVGKIGAALQLGGTAQQAYAAAPEYPQTDGDALTVAGWVYARSRPRWASIAKNWAGGNFDRGQFHFGLNFDGGELEAHIVDSSGKEIVVKDSVPLPLHSWHHVAFVADGKTLRLYRNGREVDAQPYHKLHRDPRITSLGIGTKLNLAGNAPEESDYNMWDGRLDELAIFNHALSAKDIQRLYELASSGRVVPLDRMAHALLAGTLRNLPGDAHLSGWAVGLVPATTSLGRQVSEGCPWSHRRISLVARNRVMAVDALRGFDMFWIVGGQELALAIARIFADPLPHAVARQFEHVEWEGFVAWDLIMPLFLFVVGVAMPFSFARRVEEGGSNARPASQDHPPHVDSVRARHGRAGQLAGLQSVDAAHFLQHAAVDRRRLFRPGLLLLQRGSALQVSFRGARCSSAIGGW